MLASGGDEEGSGAPHASVNIVLFDKNYKLVTFGFDQIDASAKQVGVSPVVAHDSLVSEITVKEEGYAFLYIVNENAVQADVYFDDVTMTYTPGNVIQYSEYYPYGLQTANSWTRDNSKNNFLYNDGSELNATSGWYETFFRGYDASLGRFMQVDPLATKVHVLSPYNYTHYSARMSHGSLSYWI